MKDYTVCVDMAVQGLYWCVWTWQFRDYTVCVDMAVQGLSKRSPHKCGLVLAKQPCAPFSILTVHCDCLSLATEEQQCLFYYFSLCKSHCFSTTKERQ